MRLPARVQRKNEDVVVKRREAGGSLCTVEGNLVVRSPDAMLKRVAKATHIVATQESKPRDQPTTTPRTQDGSQQWARSKPGRRPCKAREYKSSRQTRRSVPVYTVGFAYYRLCDDVAQTARGPTARTAWRRPSGRNLLGEQKKNESATELETQHTGRTPTKAETGARRARTAGATRTEAYPAPVPHLSLMTWTIK